MVSAIISEADLLPKTVDISTLKRLSETVTKIACEPPPGLSFPPGLESPLSLGNESKIQRPPGLEVPSPSECMSTIEVPKNSFDEAILTFPTVRVIGIPNALLTRPMMDAVFDQAQLEQEVVGYSMQRGVKCGEARVSLLTTAAIESCIRHFSGCQWTSDIVIRCEVIPPPVTKSVANSCSALSEKKQPFLSPDAKVFVPTASQTKLSAEAPSFVPMSTLRRVKGLDEPVKVPLPVDPATAPKTSEQTGTPVSDAASTDTGESTSECE